MWYDQKYQEMESILWWLPQGWHDMEVHYYEWTEEAKVYFNVDNNDLFSWEETEYLEIEVPSVQVQEVQKQRVIPGNRTITETVYVSLLEYLMKGGRP
jgi:hypothetical protein